MSPNADSQQKPSSRMVRLSIAAVVAAALAAAALLQPGFAAEHMRGSAAADRRAAAPGAKKIAGGESAFGREGDPRKVKRTIRIEMSDAMRYFPDQVRVKKGQTVRFALKNAGELPHEMVLGTMDDLKKHAGKMRQGADMAHDEPNVAHVAAGDTGTLVWQFTRAGEFYYGCLIPGHFEAGMIGTVVVR